MLALALILAQNAHAGDTLTLEAVRVVERGVEDPRVTFRPAVSAQLTVKVDCGGKVWTLDRTVSAGKPVTLTLSGVAAGATDCTADIHLLAADGSDGAMQTAFQVVSLPPLGLSATMDDYSWSEHSLVVHADRPVAGGTARVIGVGGVVIDEVPADISDPTAPKFRWDPRDQEVLQIQADLDDAHGFRARMDVWPWSYNVPHEDVVFATNSSDIDAGEVSKLDTTWQEVTRVLAKYGSVVKMKLYVAGYTDTVGDAASNQALSERRARSIASWFRSKGWTGEIWYQGFGEDALAVPTPDQTDLAANRRALYLLAADRPPTNPDLPRAAWKRL